MQRVHAFPTRLPRPARSASRKRTGRVLVAVLGAVKLAFFVVGLSSVVFAHNLAATGGAAQVAKPGSVSLSGEGEGTEGGTDGARGGAQCDYISNALIRSSFSGVYTRDGPAAKCSVSGAYTACIVFAVSALFGYCVVAWRGGFTGCQTSHVPAIELLARISTVFGAVYAGSVYFLPWQRDGAGATCPAASEEWVASAGQALVCMLGHAVAAEAQRAVL